MSNHDFDLISLNIRPSPYALISGTVITLLLFALIKYAAIYVFYQLSLSLVIILYLSVIVYHYLLFPIYKCNLLLNAKDALIWQGTAPQSMQITSLRHFGAYLIIIKMHNQQHQRSLILFPDSILATQFKILIRYIKWQN